MKGRLPLQSILHEASGILNTQFCKENENRDIAQGVRRISYSRYKVYGKPEYAIQDGQAKDSEHPFDIPGAFDVIIKFFNVRSSPAELAFG